MTDKTNNYPPCYGNLEIVFPLKNDGLRHSPPQCMQCVFKTECMRTAMKGGSGVQVREEALERAYRSGNVSFLERWSRKKSLHCRKMAEKHQKQKK